MKKVTALQRQYSTWPLLLLLLVVLVSACGIQFQQNSLYDGVESPAPTPRPERISLAVEPVIFQESGAYFWTPTDMDCTEGEVVESITHSGDRALKIKWDRADCEWAGFGIGWDDWAGKDLTEVFEHAAIEMYVRSEEGKMFGLPVVLTLEDYSGNMAWSYVANKYFERYFIDEDWQRVVVPLNTFDLNEDGLDIGNIKQLMFELQQAGSIYLDDIQLIYYEAPEPEVWLPEEVAPELEAYPVALFKDGFINDNGWGLYEDHCQNIRLTDEQVAEGSTAIRATWDATTADCYRVSIGVSWNSWFPIDMTKAKDNVTIKIALKSKANLYEAQNLRFGFEDYERQVSLVKLHRDFLPNGSFVAGQWQTITIPLSALPATADFSNIKQFMIQMDKQGDVYIDDIRLIRTDI